MGFVGGVGGPSGDLAPRLEGDVCSLVSLCVQNRLSCLGKVAQSCRCRSVRLQCRTNIQCKDLESCISTRTHYKGKKITVTLKIIYDYNTSMLYTQSLTMLVHQGLFTALKLNK